MLTDQEFKQKCQELKEMSANIRTQLSKTQQTLEGLPANVPPRRYSPDDRIALVSPEPQPRPRQRIEGINVPHPTEDWQSLNEWRARFNLDPVEPW